MSARGLAPEEVPAAARSRGHLMLTGRVLHALARGSEAADEALPLPARAPGEPPAEHEANDVHTPLEVLQADLRFLHEDLIRAVDGIGTALAALPELPAEAKPLEIRGAALTLRLLLDEAAAAFERERGRPGLAPEAEQRLAGWAEALAGLALRIEAEISAFPNSLR